MKCRSCSFVSTLASSKMADTASIRSRSCHAGLFDESGRLQASSCSRCSFESYSSASKGGKPHHCTPNLAQTWPDHVTEGSGSCPFCCVATELSKWLFNPPPSVTTKRSPCSCVARGHRLITVEDAGPQISRVSWQCIAWKCSSPGSNCQTHAHTPPQVPMPANTGSAKYVRSIRHHGHAHENGCNDEEAKELLVRPSKDCLMGSSSFRPCATHSVRLA